jgi:hypothetical protein
MKELIEGLDYYYNKDGFVVLTEKYHLENGYCCGNGCLHCPYNYQNVNEAYRERFLKERNDKQSRS